MKIHRRSNGNCERLEGKIQVKYGYTKNKAKQESTTGAGGYNATNLVATL